MKIVDQFKAKRCVFSIECFPPKQTTQMDKLRATLFAMSGLAPDFISVTFGAGGFCAAVFRPWRWRTLSRMRLAFRHWRI